MTGPVRRSRRWQSTSLHLSGIALLFVSAGIAVSAIVDVLVGGTALLALATSAALVAAVGVLLWRLTRAAGDVSRGGAFVAVTVAWFVVLVAGTVPYLLSGTFTRFDDALFESVSGFTTTGSSVLPGFEGVSRGVLFWRQLTQWMGGMGMIVLAVAVLPLLGVGGLELIAAEAPGESADRLAPRISKTAQRLWTIYVGFTAVGVVALMLCGLDLFDAVSHAFTTISTGGFSPYPDGIRHFDSVAVDTVVIVGMLAGATSFTLHFRALRRGPSAYLSSGEFRVFMAMVVVISAVVVWFLVADGTDAATAVRDGLFNVVGIITTTGYTHTDFTLWAAGAQLVLLLLMLSGGMTGSTSGGMKVLRLDIMGRFSVREVRRARHPRAVLPIRTGDAVVPETVVYKVVGFVLLYIGIGLVSIVVVAATGASVLDASGGVASAMGSIGPGLGPAGPVGSYLSFEPPARWLLTLLMVVGRLELVPVILTGAVLSRRLARAVPRTSARPSRSR